MNERRGSGCFGFEPRITAREAHLEDCRICQTGLGCYAHPHVAGRKINGRDGFRAYFTIEKYHLLQQPAAHVR